MVIKHHLPSIPQIRIKKPYKFSLAHNSLWTIALNALEKSSMTIAIPLPASTALIASSVKSNSKILVLYHNIAVKDAIHCYLRQLLHIKKCLIEMHSPAAKETTNVSYYNTTVDQKNFIVFVIVLPDMRLF